MNKDKIETFEELSEKILVKSDFLATYIRGHLMLEFLYGKILQINSNKYSKRISKMEHYKLIKALYDLQYITNGERDVLFKINTIRNKFVHELTFFPSVVGIQSLLCHSQNTIIEFFEGFSRGLEQIKNVDQVDIYETEILIDFFMEILYNLKCRYDYIFEEFTYYSLREG